MDLGGGLDDKEDNMKMICLITDVGSEGTHRPTVWKWREWSWLEVVKVYRNYQEPDEAYQNGKEHSYFNFDGLASSLYMVQTGYGCDGSTFLDGTGEAITRDEAYATLGIIETGKIEIPVRGFTV